MKNSLIVFLVILNTTLFSQTISKNPGNFTVVKVFDQISVQLIPGPESKVEIKGTRASEVELVNKNEELKIRMKFSKLLQGESIEVTVYYQKLESIEASEGSYVNSEKPIKGINFSLNAKEGAEIRIALDVQRASIKLNSGGKIKISGSTDNQEVMITSGGELKATNFISKQTIVSVSAGGEASIFATDFVEAKVKAGGEIYVYGKPKKIDQKTVIGGTIKEMN